ncbi:MAG TPA: VOC family protein, partial [Gammaproteobacteria bacterium]
RLDHIGFIIESSEQVDLWFTFLREHGVTMKTESRTHRDGARSFYCLDPAGNTVQMIYHPPLSSVR